VKRQSLFHPIIHGDTTMRTTLIALLAASAICCTSLYARAGELNLLCKSEVTRTDGAQADFLRRYHIDSDKVYVSDDYGNGVEQQFSTSYVQANNRIIMARPGVYHEINRLTGMMFSFDQGVRKRGICNPAT
jgi:hypothetical protein